MGADSPVAGAASARPACTRMRCTVFTLDTSIADSAELMHGTRSPPSRDLMAAPKHWPAASRTSLELVGWGGRRYTIHKHTTRVRGNSYVQHTTRRRSFNAQDRAHT